MKYTKDESFMTSKRNKISVDLFFEKLNTLFTKVSNLEITFELLTYKLTRLLKENPNLSISMNIESIISGSDIILLLLFCHLHMNEKEKFFSTFHIYMVFPKNLMFKIVHSLTDRSNILFRMNYIEHCNVQGLSDVNYYKLTESAIAELLSK